ncbi:MAG: glutathionylspermidine synthase family protein, partial [Agathobacter sp.]|nr:glutathionylspermidine synthase family protein [Agathobacter sp.]
MRLVPIPEEKYEEYRLTMMFDCFKWDPQFLDHNTVAKYALVITAEEYKELAELTERLDKETRAAEDFLNEHLELAEPLYLTKKLKKEVPMMKNYDADKHVRLMRYDFHPTLDGKWAISEVNSDVPGGFAEGSLMPQAAIRMLPDKNYSYKNFGKVLVDAIAKKVPAGGRIAMVHCTCYSDDRQVMQFLGEQLEQKGFSVIYMAADHLEFKDTRAYSLLDGNEGHVDGIVRFTPLEWLADMKTKHWQGFFDTTTTSCNHPVAIFAQSKRFPFVWDALEKNGIDMSTWRELLPDTIDVKAAKGKDGYIYKPVYGRVGENISIKESCTDEEYKMIMKEVKLLPKTYIAQKRFASKPVEGLDGKEYHVCLGSYSVDTKHAGFYARISDTPRIDSNAADIPVLIEGTEHIEGVDQYNAESFEKSLRSSAQKDEHLEYRQTGKETYSIWAPYGKKWVDWVRPVPFIEIATEKKGYSVSPLVLPEKVCMDKADEKTAVIVDLHGEDSIEMGLAFAKIGYRPIPVYNGVEEQQGARATTNNQSIDTALYYGAKELQKITIPNDAPPAFLLDTNRLQRYKMDDSIFDNSWDIYPQDIPSAKYFLSQGIDKILVIGDKVERDLKKVLKDFQKKGI